MAREIPWQEKSHGKKTNGKGEKESEASDGNSCCSVLTILLALGDRGRSVGGSRGRVGQIAQIGVGQIAQIGVGRVGQIGRVLGDTGRLALGQFGLFGPVHLTDCHD